jgi:GNAT superfamily N-acetyltransferase
MPEPRRATDAEIPGVARLLAGAFADDPVFAHLLPPALANRDRRMQRCFAVDTKRSHRLRGTWVYGTTGAAVWFPPGRALESPWEQLSNFAAYARTFGRRLGIASRLASTMARHHPREPHWYLLYIGTAARAQSTGVGGMLLEAMLAECDDRGQAAYLEATTEQSRKLYLRHGFVDRDRLQLPDGGPAMYPMWRDPE